MYQDEVEHGKISSKYRPRTMIYERDSSTQMYNQFLNTSPSSPRENSPNPSETSPPESPPPLSHFNLVKVDSKRKLTYATSKTVIKKGEDCTKNLQLPKPLSTRTPSQLWRKKMTDVPAIQTTPTTAMEKKGHQYFPPRTVEFDYRVPLSLQPPPPITNKTLRRKRYRHTQRQKLLEAQKAAESAHETIDTLMRHLHFYDATDTKTFQL